jgi:hypothetical protein
MTDQHPSKSGGSIVPDLILAGIFFGLPSLAVFAAYQLPQSLLSSWWVVGPGCVAAFIWIVSLSVIYTALFDMAEARWPKAKIVRVVFALIGRLILLLGTISRK